MITSARMLMSVWEKKLKLWKLICLRKVYRGRHSKADQTKKLRHSSIALFIYRWINQVVNQHCGYWIKWWKVKIGQHTKLNKFRKLLPSHRCTIYSFMFHIRKSRWRNSVTPKVLPMRRAWSQLNTRSTVWQQQLMRPPTWLSMR